MKFYRIAAGGRDFLWTRVGKREGELKNVLCQKTLKKGGIRRAGTVQRERKRVLYHLLTTGDGTRKANYFAGFNEEIQGAL